MLARRAQSLLRKWLHASILPRRQAGHPLRLRLLQRLMSTCAAADVRQQREQKAADAAHAARSPEQVEEERESPGASPSPDESNGRDAPGVPVGHVGRFPGRSPTRSSWSCWLLLGPDLGQDGEALLRRVAREAPAHLWPAVEKLYTDVALAQFGRGLLADLTETRYYIEDDGWGSRVLTTDRADIKRRHSFLNLTGITVRSRFSFAQISYEGSRY